MASPFLPAGPGTAGLIILRQALLLVLLAVMLGFVSFPPCGGVRLELPQPRDRAALPGPCGVGRRRRVGLHAHPVGPEMLVYLSVCPLFAFAQADDVLSAGTEACPSRAPCS